MNFWFANGEFYVHSGVSEGKTGLNDMWVFHPAKGADGWERLYDRKGMEVRGVYYGDHQFPGERENAFTSVREADNSLWMFGGSGYGTSLSQRGDLNDVRAYVCTNNNASRREMNAATRCLAWF